MDKLLIKLRQAVAVRQRSGPLVEDIRASTLTFATYRWVLIAVALVGFYYLFWASDRYETEARVYVKSTDTGSASVTQLQLIGGIQADGQDAALVNAYLQSRDLMERLERELGVFEHFSNNDIDFFSRLSSDPSEEDKLEYFKTRLSSSVQLESGILVIKGQGFDPQFSQQLVQATIKAGEEFVNGVGQKIAKEEIAFVEQELDRARKNLQQSRDQLLAFQNENGILSAESAGSAMQSIVSEMEAELVRLRTEEKALAAYLNDTASELVVVRGRITALEQQLELERARMASQDGVSVNDVYARYQELEMELKFATDLYQAALVALEKARVDSYHKLKHLVVVQAPALSDSAKYPRKLYNLATLFVALSLAYGIITMILATIREHRDV